MEKKIKKNLLWVFYIDEKKHIISLSNDGILYVDGEIIKKLEKICIYNYEYNFKINETDCSIVKSVFNKNYRLVVNGRYLDNKKEYKPLSKTISAAAGFMIAVFVLFEFYILQFSKMDAEPHILIISAIASVAVFFSTTKLMLYLANCPCKIKSTNSNTLFRVFLMILFMGVYVLLLSLILHLM